MFVTTCSATGNLLSISNPVALDRKLLATHRAGNKNALPFIEMFAIFRAEELASLGGFDLAHITQDFLGTIGAFYCDSWVFTGSTFSDGSSCCYFCLACTLPGAVYPCAVAGDKIGAALWTSTRLSMARLSVPERQRAKTTALASSRHWLITIRTNLFASISKIYVMFFTMTIYTERNAICNIKSQIGIIYPRFYMMGLYFSFCSAYLACVVISYIHGVAPFFQFCPQSSPLAFERFAIYPSAGAFACSVFPCASARAVNGVLIVSCKDLLAIRTFFWTGRVAIFPALFGAIRRRGCTTSGYLVRFIACLTSKRNTTFFHLLFLLKNLMISCLYYSRYVNIMQVKARCRAVLSPDYINIIISRWEKLTGQQATLLDRVEEATHA